MLFVALDSYCHSVEKSCTEISSFAFHLKINKCINKWINRININFVMFVWMAPLTTVSSHSIWEKTVTYVLKYYQSTWEWTWWIMHTDVMKYGREASSVIKLRAQFEHICPDSWDLEMHNRLVNAASQTQKHQQHFICALIILTRVVSGAFILYIDTICFKAHIGIITTIRCVENLMCMLMIIRWESYHTVSAHVAWSYEDIYDKAASARYLLHIVFEWIQYLTVCSQKKKNIGRFRARHSLALLYKGIVRKYVSRNTSSPRQYVESYM